MVRYRVALSYGFGEVSVEGESTKEVIDSIDQLKTIGRKAARKLGSAPAGKISVEKGLSHVIDVDERGRVKFKVPESSKLSGKEVLALLLLALDEPTSPSDLSEKLSSSWKKVSSKRVSSYLTATGNTPTIRGYVVKDGHGYKLNAAGRGWVKKEILPRLSA